MGTLTGFSAVFRGNFVVAQAGSFTFNLASTDGFILGAGGGTVRVSGANINPPASGLTVFSQYPVMGVIDGPTSGSPTAIVVSFPTPGSYPYKIDYKSGTGGNLSLALTVTQGWGTVPLPPLDSLMLTPTSNSTLLQGQQAMFTIQTTDETGAAMAQLPVLVGVTGSSQPPSITVVGDSSLTLPNPGVYQATVTDPDAAAGGAISVSWSEVSGPGTASFSAATASSTGVTFSAPGAYVLQITATDLLGSNTLHLGVTVNPAPAVVQGWPATPVDGSSVSGVVPIILASGISLTSGTLSYWPVSNPNAVVVLNSNTVGTGTIGSLDTTLLQNGGYIVALSASTGGSLQNFEATRHCDITNASLVRLRDVSAAMAVCQIAYKDGQIVRGYKERHGDNGADRIGAPSPDFDNLPRFERPEWKHHSLDTDERFTINAGSILNMIEHPK